MSINLEGWRSAGRARCQKDPASVLFGQDVGAFGGAFQGHENLGAGISRGG